MEPDFADALEVVFNAIAKCQGHLKAGDLAKARVERPTRCSEKPLKKCGYTKTPSKNQTTMDIL